MIMQCKHIGQWKNCPRIQMIQIEDNSYILTRWKEDILLAQEVSENGGITGEVKRLRPIFSENRDGKYEVTHVEILN